MSNRTSRMRFLVLKSPSQSTVSGFASPDRGPPCSPFFRHHRRRLLVRSPASGPHFSSDHPLRPHLSRINPVRLPAPLFPIPPTAFFFPREPPSPPSISGIRRLPFRPHPGWISPYLPPLFPIFPTFSQPEPPSTQPITGIRVPPRFGIVGSPSGLPFDLVSL